MPLIVLTDDQARVLTQAREPVELRDGKGNLLARVAVPLDDEIAEASRRLASEQPRWSSDQVQTLLARLTAIREQEGMDEAKLREALGRFRAGEPV
jgi:hypothetical protein